MEGFYILPMHRVYAKVNFMYKVLVQSYTSLVHSANAPAVCKIQFNEYSIIRITWNVSTYC